MPDVKVGDVWMWAGSPSVRWCVTAVDRKERSARIIRIQGDKLDRIVGETLWHPLHYFETRVPIENLSPETLRNHVLAMMGVLEKEKSE